MNCSFGTLAVDAAASFDVTVQTSAVGAITNVAQATGTTPDPVGSNDASSETSLVVDFGDGPSANR